jgi:hypothetical protein
LDGQHGRQRSGTALQQRPDAEWSAHEHSVLEFCPRLGISYSPNSKLVIRTGYGIFYNQDVGNAYSTWRAILLDV